MSGSSPAGHWKRGLGTAGRRRAQPQPCNKGLTSQSAGPLWGRCPALEQHQETTPSPKPQAPSAQLLLPLMARGPTGSSLPAQLGGQAWATIPALQHGQEPLIT